MNVRQIFQGKDRFLDLLLLGDEQEDMIARYLGRGELFALYDPNLRGVCVVTDEGAGTFELKNLAVPPKYQRRGYGRALVDFCLARWAWAHYAGGHRGQSPHRALLPGLRLYALPPGGKFLS